MASESNQVNASHGDDENRSAAQIQREIRRTRAEMDQTVDALGERLRPRHLFDDLLEMFKGWGSTSGGASSSSSSQGAISGAKDKVRDAGSRVIEKLGQNPMPAALIGAGVAWLLFDNGEKRSDRARFGPGPIGAPEPPMHSGSYVDARTGRPYDETYGVGYYDAGRSGTQPQQGDESSGGGLADKARDVARSVKDGVSSAADSVRQGVSSVTETASEWAGSARGSASQAGRAFGGYASSASGYASDRMSRGYDTSKQYIERGIEEYPLAMGAAAMSLGVLAGLLFPRTRAEDEMMGRQADALKETVAEQGRQVADAAKNVATATAGAAVGEASAQGGVESVVEKVKNVARDVKDAAVESAQREGLDAQSLKETAERVGERAKETAKEESRRQGGKVRGTDGGSSLH